MFDSFFYSQRGDKWLNVCKKVVGLQPFQEYFCKFASSFYLNIKKALAAWQALQPLSEKDRERLSRRFTVDFNYNSNHIEGNTLTYGQTEILLLFGKVIGEADIHDVEEMTASNVGLKMISMS